MKQTPLAAHCAWNIKEEMLQIGLNKYYSDYYQEEDYAQFKNISKIIVQSAYQDAVGNYGSDIAILVLSSSVEFSTFIRPACLDWNLNDLSEQLSSNKLGLVHLYLFTTSMQLIKLQLRLQVWG